MKDDHDPFSLQPLFQTDNLQIFLSDKFSDLAEFHAGKLTEGMRSVFEPFQHSEGAYGKVVVGEISLITEPLPTAAIREGQKKPDVPQ